jgi:hypothetical protein
MKSRSCQESPISRRFSVGILARINYNELGLISWMPWTRQTPCKAQIGLMKIIESVSKWCGQTSGTSCTYEARKISISMCVRKHFICELQLKEYIYNKCSDCTLWVSVHTLTLDTVASFQRCQGIGCSGRRLIEPWLYARQFHAKVLCHLPRKIMPRGWNS